MDSANVARMIVLPVEWISRRARVAAVLPPRLIEAPVGATLHPLQAAVGGYIERVSLELPGADLDLWCNENGIAEGLPLSPWAPLLGIQSPIFGSIAISRANEEGETIGLTEMHIAEIERLVGARCQRMPVRAAAGVRP